jgi:hypothetical protein
LAGQTPPGARPNKRAFKVLGQGPRVGRLTLMVTSGLDGWSPPRLGRGTELGLQVYSPKKNFLGLYAAKDKDETQALTGGLSKVKTRERMAFQQP